MERYQRLFRLDDNLYQLGSPILIRAGALLLDTKNNSVLAQIKFECLDDKQIKAIQISLKCFDVAGKELQGIDDFQYLDLTLRLGDEVGSKIPIILPKSNTRSFMVTNCTVFYSDDGIWKSEINWIPIKSPSLKEGFPEFIKQYQLEFGKCAKYKYDGVGDLWYCACGKINKNFSAKCCECGLSHKSLIDKSDSFIEEKMYERLQRERESEEQKRLEEERIRIRKEEEENNRKQLIKIKKEKLKKKIRMMLLVATVVLIVSGGTYIGVKVIYSNLQYLRACHLEENGDYDEAIVIFEELGIYKDSSEKVVECSYLKAVSLYNEGEYESSLYILEGLDRSYKEVDAYIVNAIYEIGYNYFNNGNYEVALSYYEKVGDYRDSMDSISVCKNYIKYNNAILKMESGKLSEAVVDFKELGDLENSSKYFELCNAYSKYVGLWECTEYVVYQITNNDGLRSLFYEDFLTIQILISKDCEVSCKVNGVDATVSGDILTYHKYYKKNDTNTFNISTGERTMQFYDTKGNKLDRYEYTYRKIW